MLSFIQLTEAHRSQMLNLGEIGIAESNFQYRKGKLIENEFRQTLQGWVFTIAEVDFQAVWSGTILSKIIRSEMTGRSF